MAIFGLSNEWFENLTIETRPKRHFQSASLNSIQSPGTSGSVNIFAERSKFEKEAQALRAFNDDSTLVVDDELDSFRESIVSKAFSSNREKIKQITKLSFNTEILSLGETPTRPGAFDYRNLLGHASNEYIEYAYFDLYEPNGNPRRFYFYDSSWGDSKKKPAAPLSGSRHIIDLRDLQTLGDPLDEDNYDVLRALTMVASASAAAINLVPTLSASYGVSQLSSENVGTSYVSVFNKNYGDCQSPTTGTILNNATGLPSDTPVFPHGIFNTRVIKYGSINSIKLDDFLEKVNNSEVSSRKQATVNITRFEPSFTLSSDTLRKGVIKDILVPHYRTKYPGLHWAFTNYNTLNFFTSSAVPEDTALIYPSFTDETVTPSKIPYSPQGAFTFEFYINPRYTTDEIDSYASCSFVVSDWEQLLIDYHNGGRGAQNRGWSNDYFYEIPEGSGVKWVTAEAAGYTGFYDSSFKVTFPPENSGNLTSRYFAFNADDNGTRKKYYVWFQVSGNGLDPNIADSTGVQVNINTSDTAETIATAVRDSLLLLPTFAGDISSSDATVTINVGRSTNYTPAILTVDGGTLIGVTNFSIIDDKPDAIEDESNPAIVSWSETEWWEQRKYTRHENEITDKGDEAPDYDFRSGNPIIKNCVIRLNNGLDIGSGGSGVLEFEFVAPGNINSSTDWTIRKNDVGDFDNFETAKSIASAINSSQYFKSWAEKIEVIDTSGSHKLNEAGLELWTDDGVNEYTLAEALEKDGVDNLNGYQAIDANSLLWIDPDTSEQNIKAKSRGYGEIVSWYSGSIYSNATSRGYTGWYNLKTFANVAGPFDSSGAQRWVNPSGSSPENLENFKTAVAWGYKGYYNSLDSGRPDADENSEGAVAWSEREWAAFRKYRKFPVTYSAAEWSEEAWGKKNNLIPAYLDKVGGVLTTEIPDEKTWMTNSGYVPQLVEYTSSAEWASSRGYKAVITYKPNKLYGKVWIQTLVPGWNGNNATAQIETERQNEFSWYVWEETDGAWSWVEYVEYGSSFSIAFPKEGDGNLTGKYFTIKNRYGARYYIWFKVGGSGDDPEVPGATGVQVSVDLDASASAVAEQVRLVLLGLGTFTVSRNGSVVSVDIGEVTGAVATLTTAIDAGTLENIITIISKDIAEDARFAFADSNFEEFKWVSSNTPYVSLIITRGLGIGTGNLTTMGFGPVGGTTVGMSNFALKFGGGRNHVIIDRDKSHQFHAGTILHMSSSYVISLVTGSHIDKSGHPDTYRILVQLSSSADIPPSEIPLLSNSSGYGSDWTYENANGDSIDSSKIFISSDNSLNKNKWHHVAIRWGTKEFDNGKLQILIDGTVDTEVNQDNSKDLSIPQEFGDISPIKWTGLEIISGSSIFAIEDFNNTDIKDDPSALFVGNYFEGKNTTVYRQRAIYLDSEGLPTLESNYYEALYAWYVQEKDSEGNGLWVNSKGLKFTAAEIAAKEGAGSDSDYKLREKYFASASVNQLGNLKYLPALSSTLAAGLDSLCNEFGKNYVYNEVLEIDLANTQYVQGFFSYERAQKDGITWGRLDDVDATAGWTVNNPDPVEPSEYRLRHPLNAEIHELKIWNEYRSRKQLDATRAQGIETIDSEKNLLFYLPPFFVKESRQRDVLITPFQAQSTMTSDPFNILLSFGVGAHEINLENFSREFVTGEYPILLNLTGTMLNESQEEKTAAEFLYDDPKIRKRNLTILPCDNGLFTPDFNILSSGSYTLRPSSGSSMSKFINDYGTLDLSLVGLRDLISTNGSQYQFLQAGEDEIDSLNPDSISSQLVGSTPENPTAEPGPVLAVYQRTGDSSSNEVVFFDASNLFYGKKINPGSYVLTDNDITGSGGKVKITLKDNGRGILYRADAISKNAVWSSVGNLLYEEGVATVLTPCIPYFGKEQFKIDLEGVHNIHIMEITVPCQTGMINSSSNPNFMPLKVSNFASDLETDFVYITGLNFHDENLNVIARTSLAQPVTKRDADSITFRVKMDF